MINIFISILSYDIWFYISHILLHTRFIYKYHKEHHENIIPKFLDTYHGHPFESLFQGIGFLFPFIIYSYSLTNLLTILTFLNIRGMLRHDERVVLLIGNHHLLHHKYHNYNFGEYWIDTICGTRYPNEKEYIYGLIYV